MKQYLTKKNIGLTLAMLLLLAQFKIIDKTPGDTNPSADFLILEDAPEEIAELFDAVCYDCHSNATNYPWYSNIAPISWWLKRHVDNGKRKINYSEWTKYEGDIRTHKIDETVKYIMKGWMPLGPYKWTHPEARLTDSQRNMLVDWLKSAN